MNNQETISNIEIMSNSFKTLYYLMNDDGIYLRKDNLILCANEC
jgi:hypothetical protein